MTIHDPPSRVRQKRRALGFALFAILALAAVLLLVHWAYPRAVSIRREWAANGPTCPLPHPFSPPLRPLPRSGHTRYSRQVCGGPLLGADIAVEKVIERVETGDGLGGANGVEIDYWLLLREGGRWRRHLLFNLDGTVAGSNASRRILLGREGSRLGVVIAGVVGLVVQLRAGAAPVITQHPCPDDDLPATLLSAHHAAGGS